MKRWIVFLVLPWAFVDAAGREECPDELVARYRAGQACWPAAETHPSVDPEPLAALPETPPFPEHNPHSEAKEELGKQLFFDPRLSRSEQVACASCHDPDLNWADGRRHAFGHNRRQGERNTPSVGNSAWSEHFFWDGRAATLEQQARASLTNPVEMNSDPAAMADRIQALGGYRKQFEAVFSDPEVTPGRIVKAISTYVRTITSRSSDFDDFMRGDRDAMNRNEIKGLHLFRTRAGCMNCHHGKTFSDNDFHNIGLHYFGRKHEDLGRYRVTGDPEDVGAFKTPGLRDVVHTGPWMHNGIFPTLRGILNMYNHGGARPEPRPAFEDDPLFPETSDLLEPLELTDPELRQIEAFLHSISRRARHIDAAALPGREHANP